MKKMFERRTGRARKSGRSSLLYLAGLVTVIACIFLVSPARSKYVYEASFEGNAKYENKLASIFKLEEHEALLNTAKKDGTYVLGTEIKTAQEYARSLIPKTEIPKDPFITIGGKTEIPSYLYIEVKETDALKELTTPKGITINKTGDKYTIPASDEEYRRFQVIISPAPATPIARPDNAEDWAVADPGKYTFTVRKDKTVVFELDPSYTAAFSTVKRIDYKLKDEWLLIDGITGPHGGKVYVYSVPSATDPGTREPLVIDNSNCPASPIWLIKDNKLKVIDKVPIDPATDVGLISYGYLLEKTESNTAIQQWAAATAEDVALP